MKWTTDELELLHAFVEAEYTHKEIAQELGRTRDSIKQKTNRMNIKSFHPQGKKSHKWYVAELAKKCPTMKVLEPYRGSDTKILHECLECGTQYSCRPSSKLRGHSCKFCGRKNNDGGKIDPNNPGITYLVYFYGIDVYKIGITAQTTKIRNKGQGQKYEIILEHHFDTGTEAMQLEEEWLENVKPYKLNTGLLKNGGNTETFRYNGEI